MPGRLMGDSWEAPGRLAGDNFHTPAGASTLHRASQDQPGLRQTGERQLSRAWPTLGRGTATVGTPPCQGGAVSASLRQLWAVFAGPLLSACVPAPRHAD